MLQGKKIIVGVCGSIAAYKAALLVRLLSKEGAEIQVITTNSALSFVTPLTLATLSKRPVLTSLTKGENGEWNNHVDLGLWADLFIIAPASANTLAKMAGGLCDNLLLVTYLSAKCPVMVAPAMDLDMYAHQSTQNSLRKIEEYGNLVLKPGSGELASGLVGEGRMQEPEALLNHIKEYFNSGNLKGKRVLVTAGPTYEAIDPVRFIGNHSTGKMGFELAKCAVKEGARVTLITGPTNQTLTDISIELIHVSSATEMLDECVKRYDETNICILSAAVADYRPKEKAVQKIKKSSDSISIDLVKTPDIAAELGKRKKKNQLNIGFALETENETHNASAKLKKKNFDLIVLNSLQDAGAGFGHDTNKITIIDKHNNSTDYELKSKSAVAQDIINAIVDAS